MRVTPRGGRDAVDGVETLSDGRPVLKVRVRAAPENGAANEGVRRLLAEELELPASAVRLEAGGTGESIGREKRSPLFGSNPMLPL